MKPFLPLALVLASVLLAVASLIARAGSTDDATVARRFQVDGGVTAIVVLPDGERMAVGAWTSGLAHMIMMDSGELVHSMKALSIAAPAVVTLSPDGRTLATTGRNATVRLWDTTTGEMTREITEHRDTVAGVAFSPDGKTLATGSHDQSIRIWDLATGESIRVFSRDQESVVYGLAFNGQGDVLAASYRDGKIRLWDPRDGALKATLAGHTGLVGRIAFAPDGTTLVSAGQDGTIRFWDIETGMTESVLKAPGGGAVDNLAFAPDGTMLASSGRGGAATLWNVETGEAIQTLREPGRIFWGVAFTTEGNAVVLGADDGTVVIQPIPRP